MADVNRMLTRLHARGRLTVGFEMKSHPLPTYRVWRWDDWGEMRDYGCDHRDGDTGPRWHTACPFTPERPWWTVVLEQRPKPPFDRSWVYELMGFGTTIAHAETLEQAAQEVLDATMPERTCLYDKVYEHLSYKAEFLAARPAAEMIDWLSKLTLP